MTTSQALLDMSLKEYELLRAEAVTTVERQYSLANWGVSSVAIVVATLVGGWQTVTTIPGLMMAILLVIIPAMLTAYAISWSHTITKLNQLGGRLFEIEENIANSCELETIRTTFKIPASADIRPYKYTLGWEHVLWKNGINIRIQSTIRVVGIVLAVFLLFVIAVNGVYLAGANHVSIREAWGISISAGLFWGGVWFFIIRYLYRRTIDASLPSDCLHTDATGTNR